MESRNEARESRRDADTSIRQERGESALVELALDSTAATADSTEPTAANRGSTSTPIAKEIPTEPQ